jgi:signal transduction histidine kinase
MEAVPRHDEARGVSPFHAGFVVLRELKLEVQNVGTLTVAAVLHELQGRAATVSMLAQAAALDAQSQSHDLGHRLARIEAVAREMQRILTAVRVLEDTSEPRREEIDVSALSVRILQNQIESAQELSRAEIRVQSNIRLLADPDEVEMLLGNLLGNAWKFSAHRERPEIRVTATGDALGTVVRVSDNGLGIAPEDAASIFELFARRHSGIAGSGVGLAIARRIVQRHGGRIWAEGELGVGMTVSFSI